MNVFALSGDLTVYCVWFISVVMFLCPNGQRPNMNWSGIFGSAPGQHQGSKCEEIGVREGGRLSDIYKGVYATIVFFYAE